MKLRLVSLDGKMLLYCMDGSVLSMDDQNLKLLFINYQNPSFFKGEKNRWDNDCKEMDSAPGRTLVYVNEKNELCIADANPFYKLMTTVGNNEYITVKEYADLHKRHEARIKVLCKDHKLTGAIRKGGCWFIPINAPYPEDGRKK